MQEARNSALDVDLPPGVDPTTTNAARLYSLLLSGPIDGRHAPIDLEVCRQLEAAIPEIRDVAHNNRIFARRAVRFFVNQDVKQIIDLGSGLPTDENTHEVAHSMDPDIRIVYDDNDPMTVAHAGHLLAGVPNVVFLGADVRAPEAVLEHPSTREMIDFTKPIGIVMASIMQLFGEDCDTHDVVRRYLDACPSGSYLALSHFTTDGPDPVRVRGLLDVMDAAGESLIFRTRAEIMRYFDGLEVMTPYEGSEADDLVWVNRWGAKDPLRADESGCWLLAGVGRKP